LVGHRLERIGVVTDQQARAHRVGDQRQPGLQQLGIFGWQAIHTQQQLRQRVHA
jgi:hypothetical protein